MTRNLAVSLLSFCAVAVAAAGDCDALQKLNLPHTTIKTAEAAATGSFKAPNGRAFPNLAALCRVAGSIAPSADSDIQFEVWMPATGWNGKFEGVGNGGFAGSIDYAAMAASVGRGYAVAATDTGHTGGATDAKWALNHPEKIADFGYRAIHETADSGKAIVKAYYRDPVKRAYFNSCSNGGREALMEAQRFPADYDGIIAGAPANYWTHLLVTALWNINAMDGDGYIPAKKIPAIETAVLNACDAIDGVKDGVIDDPTRCHFKAATLLCQGSETDACLTQAQVSALEKIYSGPMNAKGQNVFPGFSVGGETGMNGWQGWISGMGPRKSLQFLFGMGFFDNMLYSDAAWDYHKFSVDHDMKLADDSLGRVLNATDPDLKKFRDRGGKLIVYHGWSDPAIPPVNSVNYYNSVVAKMGAKNAATFVRLFMAPGMQHCGGGPGPSDFGQAVASGGDADHDLNAALERWVEQGTAPERVIAAKYKGATAATGVVRTRPLCAYPKVAKWNGNGSSDDAASFSCVDPGR